MAFKPRSTDEIRRNNKEKGNINEWRRNSTTCCSALLKYLLTTINKMITVLSTLFEEKHISSSLGVLSEAISHVTLKMVRDITCISEEVFMNHLLKELPSAPHSWVFIGVQESWRNLIQIFCDFPPSLLVNVRANSICVARERTLPFLKMF
jgi:hypothetical protein